MGKICHDLRHLAIAVRGAAQVLFEGWRQVALMGEAVFTSDVGQGNVSLAQQPLSAFDAQAQHELMWACSGGAPEQAQSDRD
jgi:hypothetical protein